MGGIVFPRWHTVQNIADIKRPTLPFLRCAWIWSSSLSILHKGARLSCPSSLSSRKFTLCATVASFCYTSWSQYPKSWWQPWIDGLFVNLCRNALFLLQTVVGDQLRLQLNRNSSCQHGHIGMCQRRGQHTCTETHLEYKGSGNNSCNLRNTWLLPGESDKWEVIDPSLLKKNQTPKAKRQQQKTQ